MGRGAVRVNDLHDLQEHLSMIMSVRRIYRGTASATRRRACEGEELS